MKKIRYPRRSERGQALILIALAVAGLLGLTALAVDGSHVYAQLRQAQNAADTAAFAGAIARIKAFYQDAPCDDAGIQNALQTAALTRAASNNFADNPPAVDVTVNNPPDDTAPPAYIGDCNYVQVIIKAQIPTFFARIVGVDSLPIHVQAVAKGLPARRAPVRSGNGIIGLGDGCGTVTVYGGGTLSVLGGAIFSNSSAAGPSGGCYAFILNGAGTQLTTPDINVVGCIKPADIPYINFPPGGGYNCGEPQIPYPMPAPDFDATCSTPGSVSSGVASPGNYGDFPPPHKTVTSLLPGKYCISGDFIIQNSDTMTGDGVLFIVNGNVKWTGGTFAFTPITEAQDPNAANLLIYTPYIANCDPATNPNRCHSVIVNGGPTHLWRGTIFGPDSHCQVSGDSAGYTLEGQVICYDVQVGGSTTWNLNYDAATEWKFPYPPETELNH